MEPCPVCGEKAERARVTCGGCGRELPLRVVVISEATWGPGFAVVTAQPHGTDRREREHERCSNKG